MKRTRKILICGGGIAGPACAWWLSKYGFSVVVVEKASGFRDGGQNVDVKGAGQQVINLMGLTEQIKARDTLECGQKWLDAAGTAVAFFPKGGFGSLTSDFEILRGDFARILFDATRSTSEYRFGTSVSGIEELHDGVRATFVDGSTEEFELVICADGLGSSTRDLALAHETRLRYLGAYMAFFQIPRRPEDDLWACSVNGIGGTMINLRPGGPTETTVLVTFPVIEPDPQRPLTLTRREMLREALEGRGTVADRIVAELDAVQDFYFGPMSQVQASTWAKGRLVLLGDAAHCPTPFTGKGTALCPRRCLRPGGGAQAVLDSHRRLPSLRKHSSSLRRALAAGTEPSTHSTPARQDGVRDSHCPYRATVLRQRADPGAPEAKRRRSSSQDRRGFLASDVLMDAPERALDLGQKQAFADDRLGCPTSLLVQPGGCW